MDNPTKNAHFDTPQGAFREAMSLIASPITVVTMRDQKNNPRGFTASSVTSLSLEPPLLLVGVSHTSSCFTVASGATDLMVNILGADQGDLAMRFAASGVDRFAGVRIEHWKDLGIPFLADAPVVIHCEVADRATFGDHDLLIGRFLGMKIESMKTPLVWYRRNFLPIG
ncbi:flavin reductase family protein [Streptomyces neyagawaensis]|uniref:flavin reductase family protein n=2 Tax=Streptomyces neyagawaensis TaxID=42238 RepID=UPI0006E2AAD3|nr:flavin reductase family protein [Streptomyces neyagawaensis]MCL6739222.1 flavin reductase family protein [Streptomyces neyagawaensis]MDE1688818.1 flavin reductase family protein [Streptomyces neyagawaensis]